MKTMQATLLVVLVSLTLVYCSYHQEHIARTDDPNSMVVSWFTKRSVVNAHVKYYRVADQSMTAAADSATFNASVGYVHHAVIKSLSPNTLYSYTVLIANNTYGQIYTFRTSNTSFNNLPYQIPLYGDMGITNSLNTMSRVRKLIQSSQENTQSLPIPFILHVGDISYADDRKSILYEQIWTTWFNMMSSVLTSTPYMVCPGNHEHESGTPFLPYSQFFVDFNYRFHMPLSTPLSSTPYYSYPHNMYWSFTHQNLHIISISTETDYKHSPYTPNFGDQLTWLKNDLIQAQRNRNNVPWIIVMGHRPLYSSAKGGYFQNAQEPLREAIEELLHENKVDAYFNGHVHAYERTLAVYRNKTDEAGGLPTVTAGGAGCTEGLLTEWIDPRPEWSAKIFDQDETYGVITVESDSVMKWEAFSAKNGDLIDQVVIKKKN